MFLMYFGCACIGDLHYWFATSWDRSFFLPVLVPATAAAVGAVLLGGPSSWFLVDCILFLEGEPTPVRESAFDCLWSIRSLDPSRAAVAVSPVGVQLRHAGEVASYPWSPDDAWLTLWSAPPLPMCW